MFAIEAKHVDIVKYLLEFPDIKLDSQTKVCTICMDSPLAAPSLFHGLYKE